MIEDRLKELGITIPTPAAPVANYVGYTVSGSNTVYVSGQLPFKDGVVAVKGKLGLSATVEQGYEAARLCALNILGHVRAACGGDLERVVRVLKVTGFVNGIATNVNGDKPPKKGTADGWHIAKAQGLDSRLVLGMEMDEAQPATVYVTLAGYTGNMRPPGSYLDPNAAKIGTGVVFKSTDAGETFTDISGDLPRIQTNTILLHKNPDGMEQLIVGTDLGPFISSDNQGSSWAPLGKGLPNVPVAMLRFKPKATAVEQTTVFAATFGRGFWVFPIAEAAVGGSSSSCSRASSSGGGSGGSSSGATTSSSSGASPLDPAPQTDPSSTHQGKQNTGRFGGGSFGFALLALIAPLALRRRRGLLSV